MWGIILILLGIILLLKNMEVLWVDWYSIFKLWPFIFIFWGISVLPMKDYIKIILGVVVIAIGIYSYTLSERGFLKPCDDEEELFSEWEEQKLTEPYSSNITLAVLKLTAAGGDFHIDGSTDNLIDFNKTGGADNYNMSIEKQGDSTGVIRIELDNHIDLRTKKHNVAKIQLNSNPIWDMDFDVGAANAEFDLRDYRTKTIEINGGAATVDLKLGDKFYRTELIINTGASSIILHIPKNSGCEVDSDLFLVDKELEGFKKNSDGKLVTDNFKVGSNKIFIKINAVISSLKIERY